jgi:hypothetical protein
MTKIVGGHNIKAGWRAPLQPLDYSAAWLPLGQLQLRKRCITCRDRFTCPGNQGNGLATMMLGWTTGSDFHIEPKAFSRSSTGASISRTTGRSPAS